MVLVAEARPVIVHSDVDGFEYFSPSPTNLTIGQRPRQSTGICVYQERERENVCVCVRERERESFIRSFPKDSRLGTTP